MFGGLLVGLENGVTNNKIRKLTKECKNFNKTRREIVHGITNKISITEIKECLDGIKKQFEIIINLFSDIYKEYQATFHQYGEKYKKVY